MSEMAEITGDAVIARFSRSHPHNRECPVCGDSTNVAIVNVAYVFEECACDQADYVHLTERLYHRVCLPVVTCTKFRPFWVRGTRAAPGHFTTTCAACGRTEEPHLEALRNLLGSE